MVSHAQTVRIYGDIWIRGLILVDKYTVAIRHTFRFLEHSIDERTHT
jgi:hypothetical protein